MVIYVDGQVVELDVKIYEPFPETDHIADARKLVLAEKEDGEG